MSGSKDNCACCASVFLSTGVICPSWLVTLKNSANKKNEAYVKGAPERIIDRCDYELVDGKKVKLNSRLRSRLVKIYEEMAKNLQNQITIHVLTSLLEFQPETILKKGIF